MLKLIKTQLEGAKGPWSNELPRVLWAYRTTVRTPTGEIQFKMAFGTKAVIPVAECRALGGHGTTSRVMTRASS